MAEPLQIQNTADLDEMLKVFRKALLLDFNCHHVGTIEKYDASKQLAQVSINYKKTYFRGNAQGALVKDLVDYPVMLDVPVINLCGGGFSLTLPVTAGDECLVLFNDRDFDTWYSGNSKAPNPTPRLHSYADAIALVGIRSAKTLITNVSTSGAELRNKDGSVKVAVTNDGIELHTASGVKFELLKDGKFAVTNSTGEFVDALLTCLQTATAGGYPLIADLSVLQSFKV